MSIAVAILACLIFGYFIATTPKAVDAIKHYGVCLREIWPLARTYLGVSLIMWGGQCTSNIYIKNGVEFWIALVFAFVFICWGMVWSGASERIDATKAAWKLKRKARVRTEKAFFQDGILDDDPE